MAIYTWSELTDGQSITFNLGTDQLVFDGGISAADILFSGVFNSIFTYGGKTVTLNNVLAYQFVGGASTDPAVVNVRFADGSLFKIGDNTTGTANDDAANTVVGGSGDDFLYGAGGADSIFGDSGNDLFPINGASINGVYGNDTINGGAGIDVITYVHDNGYGVTVNLGNETANGSATGGDSSPGSSLTLIGIEGAIGTDNADVFNANSATLVNGLSTDIVQFFEGGAGNDTINGAAGDGRITLIQYFGAATGVTVNLATGTASDGLGGTDTFSNIDGVVGSAFNDSLVGGAGNFTISGVPLEFFEGMDGNDTIVGSFGPGGGGERGPYASYEFSPSGVAVSISFGNGTALDGWGGTDTLLGIHQARGSAFDDTLTGGVGDDLFEGMGGDDTLDGSASEDVDRASYQLATGPVYVNLALGTAQGIGGDNGVGADVLVGMEAVLGSDFDDSLVGGGPGGGEGGQHTEALEGRAGNDTLDGGGAPDFLNANLATYQKDPSAVIANLSSSPVVVGAETVAGGSARDGYGVNGNLAGTDTLIDINALLGSSFDDTLVGGAGGTGFVPAAGDDSIVGGAGADTLFIGGVNLAGGAIVNLAAGMAFDDGFGGADTLVSIENVFGGAFNDHLVGDGGSNLLAGEGGNDALDGGGAGDTGNDTLDGGDGTDTVLYRDADTGVTVNLLAGFASAAGFGWTDLLTGIENVEGSEFNDIFTGTKGPNVFSGHGGSDTLNYSDSQFRVVVNMFSTSTIVAGGDTVQPGTATDGWGSIDAFSRIENVIGSAYSDYMQGSGAANRLEGGLGNDTLFGSGNTETSAGGMNDALFGGPGDDRLFQTKGADTLDGGDGTFDRLDLYSTLLAGGGALNINLATGVSNAGGGNVASVRGVEFVVGTPGIDVFTGGDPLHAPGVVGGITEFFQPLGGNDTLTGAPGRGWSAAVDYSANAQPVTVVLGNSNNLGVASDGFGGADTLIDVEQARGGAGNDLLVGGSYSQGVSGVFFESFRGNSGNDTIDGGGSDTVIGARGVVDRAEYSNSGFAVVANIGTTPISGDFYGTGVITVAGGTARDGRSSTGGGTDTLIDINALQGSNANDTLVGGNSAFDNFERFEGRGGNDSLVGGSGSDEADYTASPAGVSVWLGSDTAPGTASDGTGGFDILVGIEWVRGSDFSDTLVGGSNALERFTGGPGSDYVDGGDTTGVNYASFTTAGVGASATLSDGLGTASDGFGGTDTLVRINGLWGSNFNDTLTGQSGDQWLQGRGGSDILNGGAGTDTASYRNDPLGVTVNLAAGTATDGWGGIWGAQGTDSLTSIENVEGSESADSITGDGGPNRLDGRGGNDVLNGGAGTDTAVYSSASSGIVVNLQAGTASADGFGGADALSLIENVLGSDFADSITGSNGANLLEGGAGNDTLDGGGASDTGNDTLDGGAGDDWLRQTKGTDSIAGGEGEDVLAFNDAVAGGVNVNLAAGTSAHGPHTAAVSGVEVVIGTSSADTLTGGEASHAPDTVYGANGVTEYFQPLAGNDTITGAAGDGWITFVDYSSNTSGQAVTVVLGNGSLAGSAADGLGGADVLVNVDGAIGGAGSDSLVGGSLSKRVDGVYFENFLGNAGNDTLSGAGADTTVGAAGRDRADYESSPYGVVANMGTTNVVGNFYGAGTITVAGGSARDGFSSTGGGTDTLVAIDWLRGGDHNDTLVGGNAAHDNEERYTGRGGSDSLVGGSGADTLTYGESPLRVIVNLFSSNAIVVGSDTVQAGTARDGWGGTDTVSGMENVIGSAFDDHLQGNTNVANRLEGGAGNDVLIGSGISESAAGGAQNDVLIGGAGDDTLRQTRGNDTIDGGDGTFDRLEFGSNGILYGGAFGVHVNLAAGTSDADPNGGDSVNGAGGDVATISSIEFVVGTAGDDVFIGGDPLHTIDVLGNSLTEAFRPSGGNDTITGVVGNGLTTRVEYSTSVLPVTVVLGNSNNVGWAIDGLGGTDTLINVDWVRGGLGNDSLVGGSYATGNSGIFLEYFRGNAGNDTIDGGGSDLTIGARGSVDRVDYFNSPFPVVVNIGAADLIGNFYGAGVITVASGTARDGFDSVGGGTDTLLNINALQGGIFNDTLVGGNPALDAFERLEGREGNDYLDGGSGSDEAHYGNSLAAVFVDLGAGTASDGFGGTDTLISIEWARGSDFNDTLIGSDVGEIQRFTGDAGDDTIDGKGGGVDYVSFALAPAAANAFLENGSGTAFDGMNGTDTYVNIEGLTGSPYNDTLTGGAGSQWFRGTGGNDSITGGADTDTASYRLDPLGVSVDLGANTAIDGWGGVYAQQGTDTLFGIENVEGSEANDSITGDTGANLLSGYNGNDTLDGGGASDTGNDTLDGGEGDDWLRQTKGTDSIAGGEGEDVLAFNDAVAGGVNVNLAAGTSAHGPHTAAVSGVEVVIGTSSADTFTGGEASHAPDTAYGANGVTEYFQPLGGNDTITGAAGDGWITFVDYSSNTSGQAVTVVLGNGDNIGAASYSFGGDDTLVNVDGVIGGAGSDSLVGGSLSKRVDGVYFENFLGNAGNDTLSGAGADTTVGAAGRDRADYESSPFGVVVNMGATNVVGNFYGAGAITVAGGSARDGFDSVGGGTDTLVAIDWLRGGDHNDTLVGGNAAHDNEERYTGRGGSDSLVGGSGTDTLTYGESPLRVIVNLFSSNAIVVGSDTVQPGTARDGWGGTDTVSGMENVVGSAFDDHLQGGSNVANRLEGGAGNDVLVGSGTLDTQPGAVLNDTLIGGAGDDTLRQTRGNDFIDGGDGTFDRLEFGSNGILYGGAFGVHVDLAAGTSDADPNEGDSVNGAGGDVATISSIEFVVGTAGDDVFIGGDPLHAVDALGNWTTEAFRPSGGNDTITGADGNGWTTRVEYTSSVLPVTVVLGNSNNIGWAIDGLGGTDTLINVDWVRGGLGNDSLVGGSYATGNSGIFLEFFRGGAGNDTIDGGGSDLTIGARGSIDRVDYFNSPFPVVANIGAVDLIGNFYGAGVITVASGTARDGFDSVGGGTDTLLNINALQGGLFNDTLIGGNPALDAFERLEGREGNDYLDGGSGSDEAYYGNSPAAVLVDLGSGTALDGHGGADTLISIEWARGSEFNDTLIGSDVGDTQRLTGDAGDDTIDGKGGGVDYVSFGLAPAGANAFLENGSGTASDGTTGTDTYVNIEGLSGSSYADTLTGGAGSQWFRGMGGNDSITGGADTDTVSYRLDPLGVSVDLGANTAIDGWGGVYAQQGTDTLFGIENVEGSEANDSITGDTGANLLSGYNGNDTLDGGAGNDTMAGGAGDDVYFVDSLNDLVLEAPDEGIDTVFTTVTLTIPDNVENVIYIGPPGGGITGNDLDNLIAGNNTDNALDGGDGSDTVTYAYETNAVSVDLNAGVATGSGTDTLVAFENAAGGAAGDTLTGTIGANTLNGRAGADTMTGGLGADTYYVDNPLDAVVETSNSPGGLLLPGGGGFKPGLLGGVLDTITDTIIAAINFSLENLIYVERIALTGDATSATGNSLPNTMEGNQLANTLSGLAGNDTLDGLGGDDTLTGGLGVDNLFGGGGNDLHVVASTATAAASQLVFVTDMVSEAAGEGIDTVTSNSSYTLPDNVENLILTGGSYWRALVGTGNEGDNAITGQGAGRHQLYGSGGADTLDGGAGADQLDGGSGDDVLVWDSADTSINGGNGSDTVRIDGSGQVLDLTGVAGVKLINVEMMDLTGIGNNTLELQLSEVLALVPTGNALRVDGSAGDYVNVTDGGWTQIGDQAIGANNYHRWTNSTITLLIDTDVGTNLPIA